MPYTSFAILAASSVARERLAAIIKDTFKCEVFAAADLRSAMSLVSRERSDVILIDSELQVSDGQSVREAISELSPRIVVVVVDAPGELALAAAAPQR